jgi:hypothetical protein
MPGAQGRWLIAMTGGHLMLPGCRRKRRVGFVMASRCVSGTAADRNDSMSKRFPVPEFDRSWPIQRALIVTSLDADRATVLADWTTPRPMNTRLGPEQGIVVSGGEFYIVCAHGYGDHWIFNRTLIETALDATGRSELHITSATEEDNNDFHACNVTATWHG